MPGWTREAEPATPRGPGGPKLQHPLQKPMRPSDNPFQLYDDPEEGATPEAVVAATQELKVGLSKSYQQIEQTIEAWGRKYTKLGATDTATREAALVYSVRALKNFLELR
jgi:hypothetical protein